MEPTRRQLLMGLAAVPAIPAAAATKVVPVSAALLLSSPPPHMLAPLFDAANKIPDFTPPTSKDAFLMETDWDFEGVAQELAESQHALAHEWVVEFNEAKHMAEVVDWMRDTARLYPDFDFRWLTSISHHGSPHYEVDFQALTQANLGKKGKVTHWKDDKEVVVTVQEDEHFKTNLAFMADKLNRLPYLRGCRTLTEAADYLESLLPSYFDSKILPPLRAPLPDDLLSAEYKIGADITPTFRAFLKSPPAELRESLSHFSRAIKLIQSVEAQPSANALTTDQAHALPRPSFTYELLEPITIQVDAYGNGHSTPTKSCTDQHQCGRLHSPVALMRESTR